MQLHHQSLANRATIEYWIWTVVNAIATLFYYSRMLGLDIQSLLCSVRRVFGAMMNACLFLRTPPTRSWTSSQRVGLRSTSHIATTDTRQFNNGCEKACAICRYDWGSDCDGSGGGGGGGDGLKQSALLRVIYTVLHPRGRLLPGQRA